MCPSNRPSPWCCPQRRLHQVQHPWRQPDHGGSATSLGKWDHHVLHVLSCVVYANYCDCCPRKTHYEPPGCFLIASAVRRSWEVIWRSLPGCKACQPDNHGWTVGNPWQHSRGHTNQRRLLGLSRRNSPAAVGSPASGGESPLDLLAESGMTWYDYGICMFYMPAGYASVLSLFYFDLLGENCHPKFIFTNGHFQTWRNTWCSRPEGGHSNNLWDLGALPL